MSPELLLLLIAFILLPLIQQLLRVRAEQRTPDRSTDQPALGGQPAPQPTVPAPLRRGPAGPRAPKTARRQLAGAAAHQLTAPLEAAAIKTPAPPVRPRSRRQSSFAGLRNAHSLRRSIVLITILGPCRAIDPYPNRSEPR